MNNPRCALPAAAPPSLPGGTEALPGARRGRAGGGSPGAPSASGTLPLSRLGQPRALQAAS